MHKLTREEIRIIELTKKQGQKAAEADENKDAPTKWSVIKPFIIFIIAFLSFILIAYFMVYLGSSK